MKEVTIYINVLKVSAIEGYEKFVPQPKLGNLVDPAKILKKEKEHWAKFEENPAVCPVICQVDQISYAVFKTEFLTEGEEHKESGIVVGTVQDLIQCVEDDPANFYEIISLSPTACLHLLRVHAIRNGIALPDFLKPMVHTRNPVRDLLGVEAEWPSCMEALGQESTGPTEDCIWLNTRWRSQ